ncbi:OsmC family protein [Croceivirga sp. JEA036]|uniref:OsmC family protein n=1 Tax=Croceivirga sp. JEA036 TaxID=2721162 RepID=UPI00143AE73F|nr:OsmC family protein [Croceivirga sp. JEA036]NJB37857.1 OsmC family protein [Croceivirga sp. JEA036]
MKQHHYTLRLKWTGNTGQGTKDYKSYQRDHLISIKDKQVQIPGSADPNFRGDPTKYNPEELFLSSLASCHMLWYLHLCSTENITVLTYIDNPIGIMAEEANGSGKFTNVILHPEVTIKEEDKIELAKRLHHKANQFCFIANSCNFEIKHEPVVKFKI